VDGCDLYEGRRWLMNLLLICKHLSASLGPMMFSRLEVIVWEPDRNLCWSLCPHDDVEKQRALRQRAYDTVVSSLHRSLVEKYDRRRVWVDGPDRDRELGLFRALDGRIQATFERRRRWRRGKEVMVLARPATSQGLSRA
jgi:hypothetical protein